MTQQTDPTDNGPNPTQTAPDITAGRLGTEAAVEELVRAGLAELAPREHSP